MWKKGRTDSYMETDGKAVLSVSRINLVGLLTNEKKDDFLEKILGKQELSLSEKILQNKI